MNSSASSMSFFSSVKTYAARLTPSTPLSWMGWMAVPMVAFASFFAFSQSATPPAYQQVALANEPLYASTTIDKPALALALSVEYPTVGAQYTPGGNLDNTYSNATEYLGYYDAESCYTYNNTPTETPASGLTTADYKRFDRSGPATNRRCTNAFSGNFLNWASSSAIDMLRVALSGGDRYIDTENLTILQRAVIPNGDPICMWNSTNFPAKQLTRNGDGSNSYWGAVPTAMITQANGNDIWVANTLNRIYFKAGTAASGNCGSTGDYILGGPATGNQIESPVRSGTALPAGATQCINGETGTCAFTGIKEVWYGAGSKWAVAAANNGVDCSAGCNNVFGDPFPGTAKKVYYRNYTGTWTPPSGGTLNSDGFFFARVQVCNVNGSGSLLDSRDYGLCRQYPSGKYKPTGVIQKYSDQMRLAAFGYLMDQTASYNAGGRYGGVLRAPMKYVGTKTFDTNGQDNTPTGGNSAAEWNATTGVFNPNPDGDTTQNPAISGVINYLNKFGRTGPTPGRYKIYDPVGELHYETLRYLQGLQPSADAISNITTAMQDGFPVYTNWSDPYGGGRSNTADYSCVKSNIVVIGDINTHDGNRLPTANAANNIPDIAYWRGIANSFERNSGGTYVDGQGTTQTISNPNPANNSMPTGSQTSQIIGSAYWSHIKDIRGTGWTADTAKQRPGLRVKTFIFDVNEYGGSNNYATRSTSNQFFMAAKYGGFESDPANRGGRPYNTKGNPFKNQNNANDNAVWQKAGTPGDPLSYYLQSNARGVLNAFDEIFSRASTAARSIAGGGASSSNASSSTMLYTARFDTSNWSGDVVAEPITANASTHQLNVGAIAWSAANKLDTRASAATSRNIVVGRESGTANPPATTFIWGNIDTTLQTHLNKASPTATADTRGQDRLNYIRGDRTLEGNPFRVRSSLLGDIVNSTVVYSGAPSKAYSGTGYSAFVTTYGSRTPAVFAGANDGMLHAFNANDGTELFGFIPSWLGPKLSALTDPTFATTHQSYVDAPIAVSEAQVASAGAATDWKTVLVAGTGAGGSGVFALDVSNPAAFDTSKVMWEFKRTDDRDMGQVIGQPRILKFKTSGSAASATYRWFAVVASGVNNYVPDLNGNFSSSGQPALFLLALDKPAGTGWAEGTNYFKISFPVDTSITSTTAPGLVNFNVLYGNAGEVTDIYAGDMHGRLWKMSFSSLATSDWNFGKLSFFNKGTAAAPDPYPMFIAKTGTASSSPIQPITAAPTLFPGPVTGGLKTYYVAFGTGKYMESSDNTSTLTNSFYVVYDNGSSSSDGGSPITAAISGRGRLIAGTVNTTTKTISVGSFTWGRPSSDTGTTKAGWYFDMPVTGEKLISHVLDLSPRTGAFNTVIPGSSGASPGSCSNTPGSGNQYTVDIVAGNGSSYVTSLVGMPGPAIFFTDDSETTETKSDSTGRRIRTIVKRGLTVGQSGVSTAAPAPPIKETVGRLMWRQIYNYRDQKS